MDKPDQNTVQDGGDDVSDYVMVDIDDNDAGADKADNDDKNADDDRKEGGKSENSDKKDANDSDDKDGDKGDDDSDDKDGDKDKQDADKQGKKSSVQQRINKAVYAQRRAEREAEEYRQNFESLRKEFDDLKKGLTPTKDGVTLQPARPNPKDFEYGELDPKYQEAKDEFLLAQAEERAFTRLNASRQEEAADQESRTLRERGDALEAAGVQKYDDFAEVVTEAFTAYPLDKTASHALVELDNAVDVLYHLANNSDELAKISAKSAPAQAAELGRLSARLTVGQNKQTEKPITKAKPIPEQARGADGKFESNRSLDSLYTRMLREFD